MVYFNAPDSKFHVANYNSTTEMWDEGSAEGLTAGNSSGTTGNNIIRFLHINGKNRKEQYGLFKCR